MKTLRVLKGPINVPAGYDLRLTTDQIRRREKFLEVVNKKEDVYKLLATTQFKTGEIFDIDKMDIPKSLVNSVEVLHSDEDVPVKKESSKTPEGTIEKAVEKVAETATKLEQVLKS